MGRRPKSQVKDQGAGASATLPSGPSSAPAPESVQFTAESVKEQLRGRYVQACSESANKNNQPREQAQFAMLAARLLKDIAAIAQFEEEQQNDERLADAADRLEKLMTKGAGRAGGADTDPPFDAPETQAPH